MKLLLLSTLIPYERNRAKRKCHTSLFVFHILDLKIVANYSQLNSATENLIDFFLKVSVVPRKVAKLQKGV